eukprot:2709416-Alexandrium_andersonii.AAC.1
MPPAVLAEAAKLVEADAPQAQPAWQGPPGPASTSWRPRQCSEASTAAPSSEPAGEWPLGCAV